jgi:hypothetical protein
MTDLTSILFWFSLAGLSVLAVLSYRKSRNLPHLLMWIALLAVCGGTYYAVFQTQWHIASKGEQPNQTGFVIVLYVCMLLGMASHYFYTLLLKPKRDRDPFDLGALLAPVFASPLVFIPLLGAFQNSQVDLATLTLPKMMVFFVAFENGFFWKEVVDNRRKEQAHDH